MTLGEGFILQGGKYRIIKVLGQGGPGITYEAEQPLLRRIVAIKELIMKDCCERDNVTSKVAVGTCNQRKYTSLAIMKILYRLLILLAFCPFLSCTNYTVEDAPNGLFVFPADRITIESNITVLTVRCAEKWDITSIPDWVSISSIERSRKSSYEWEVVLSSSRNSGYDRFGEIVVKTKSQSKTITVYQYGEKGEYYLTFEIVSGGLILWKAVGMTECKTIEYSRDDGDSWTSITATDTGTPISVSTGEKLLFRGDNSAYANGFDPSGIMEGLYLNHSGIITANLFSASDDVRFYAYGPVTSLLNINKRDRLEDYAFTDLFHGCTGLMSHPSKELLLPSDKLGRASYASMFEGCTNLNRAPKLPALSLAADCYHYMFLSCTSLIQSPILPAKELTFCCYHAMFANCTILEQAGDLFSETLDVWSCCSMFYGCRNLKIAPKLPATSLAPRCYAGMFKGCESLIKAPELPANVLSESCYGEMFCNCTSLTTAPALPAKTLSENCYGGMFAGCSSLVKAPSLPASVLQKDCYSWMFVGCTSLSVAPELPATELASGCYSLMFAGCTSLTIAPDLPATKLTTNCYSCMFEDCSKLNYIKCLATVIYASGCLTNWMYEVASSGTFVKSSAMNDWSTGSDGIPNGWTVVNN